MLTLDALKLFQDDHYARHLVLRSENVEILVVCWRPGQGSPVHGHGRSDGLMIILEGEITNTSYCPDGKKVTTVWQPGMVGHTPVGHTHEVKNTSTENVVSLHIYAPPLKRELQGADMGYHNDVIPREVTLPDSAVSYLLGCAAQKTPLALMDPGL